MDRPVPVAVSRQVAEALGLQVGQRLRLESAIQPGSFAPVQVAGVFGIDDPDGAAGVGDDRCSPASSSATRMSSMARSSPPSATC